MKKTTLLGILLIAITFFTGCKKDNGSSPTDSFVGIYNVTESWAENGKTLTKSDFSMTALKSTQNNYEILLNNFANYGAGITAEAYINGNTITIPKQTLPNSKVIDGSGTRTDTTLTITYTESSKNYSLVISAIAKRR